MINLWDHISPERLANRAEELRRWKEYGDHSNDRRAVDRLIREVEEEGRKQ